MKEEYFKQLAKWHENAKEEDKQGLRLIYSILKYQGKKKFRAKYEPKDEKAVFLSDKIEYFFCVFQQ